MDPLSLLWFLILISLSSFFSASETAFMGVAMHKASALLKEKKSWAKALYKLKQQPERMLIAILIWNNIVNIFAASLATVIALDIAQRVNYEWTAVITASTIIVTILVLLFGEIFPKTFATRHSERISLLIAPIYTILIKIFYPIILILEWMMKGLTKNEKKSAVSESDLEAFIDLSRKAGILDQTENKRIKNLLNLDELTAEDIMTPRIKIKALDDEKTLDEAIEILTEYHFSRIPVYHENIDMIDRVVTLKELLRIKHTHSGTTPIHQLDINPIIKIPRSQPIDTLLEKFQKVHKHIAVVIDEYGGVEGIVSLEDIIEEVFGEIQDESDEELTPINKLPNGEVLAQSYVRIDEVLASLGIGFDSLGIDEEYEAETLSYFITSHLERFPTSGETIQIPLTFHEDFEHHLQQILEIKILWVKKNVIGEVKLMVKEHSHQ